MRARLLAALLPCAACSALQHKLQCHVFVLDYLSSRAVDIALIIYTILQAFQRINFARCS